MLIYQLLEPERKMKILKNLCKAGLVIGLVAAPNLANAESILLGRTVLLEHTAKGAQIPVNPCRRVNALQVEARRELFLSQVLVKFSNGETKTFGYHRQLKEGEKTDWRPFHLSNRKRCVTHLEVKGTSKSSTGGIRLYGRK